LFDEAVRQTYEDIKITVSYDHGKYYFYNLIPCEIGHQKYQSHASFLNSITFMDQYGFEEIKWRGYNPNGIFAAHWRLVDSKVKVKHDPNEFEDKLINALKNDFPSEPIWS